MTYPDVRDWAAYEAGSKNTVEERGLKNAVQEHGFSPVCVPKDHIQLQMTALCLSRIAVLTWTYVVFDRTLAASPV
jgi:hypothetical protein